MKRLLLLLALCLMLAAPVMATGLTLQKTSDLSSLYYTSGYQWNATGGNSWYLGADGTGFLTNKNPSPSTYAAATRVYRASSWEGITLYDSTLTQTGGWQQGGGGTDPTRFEVNIVGSTPYYYKNGILVGTGTALAQNPSHIGFNSGWSGFSVGWDDFVYGSSDSKYIVGMPQQNAYYLKKDMVNPSASGLYNSTTGTRVSTTSMTTTWGRSNITYNGNESIYLINVDSGTVYDTRYTGTASCGIIYWDVGTSMFAGSAPYGRYQVKFGDYYSDEIPYIADGAEIFFNADSYMRQDTATITYNIDGAYWDTSTYAYSMKIYSANDWSVVSNQPVSAQSGTMTYQFTTSDPQGEYYAVLVAVPNVGGDDIWMNYDYASLSAYAKFTGWVNNQSGYPISGANVNFSQNSIISNSVTIDDGNYTAEGFLTGATLVINVTKSGYSQYYVTMIPMVAKSIPMNITLNSTSPACAGLCIGGIHRDGILTGTLITSGYGRPIPGATAHAVNTTNGDYCTNVSNNAGWYIFDESNGCVLTSGRLYDVFSTALGYSASPNYTVVA